MKKNKTLRLKAMTLTELLIVLAILGLLITLAVPLLQPLFQKARSVEAKNALTYLAKLENMYHLENARYTTDLEALGFEQEQLKDEDGNGKANYKVYVVEASASNFTARAEAVIDFDNDGIKNIWEIDKSGTPREVVQD